MPDAHVLQCDYTVSYIWYVYRLESVCFRLLPETTAWQGEEAEHGQQHSEGQQGEDVQEGVHTQEEAKDHQLEKSHNNTSKSNDDCQHEGHAVSKAPELNNDHQG